MVNMFPYKYKTFNIKKDNFKFKGLEVSTKYNITYNLKCKSLYDISKDNDLSFYNLCIAAIYKTLEEFPELKHYMVEKYIKCNPDIGSIKPLENFNSFKQWNDFLENIKKEHRDFFNSKDFENIDYILFHLPWLHYSEFLDIQCEGERRHPMIHWSRYKNGKIRVTFTSNQTLIPEYQLRSFFNKLSEYMQNPDLIFSKIN